MSLSADEQRELAETFREELEADHERRVAKVREREDREAARRARAEQDAREVAFQELEARAAKLGANAVVGVDIDYEVVGKDGSMLMVSVSGTAVVVE